MTRINCISVKELSDQHLLAEFRELPRVRHADPINKIIPSSYRMGKGHVTFFYNKGTWLENRHADLQEEINCRGLKMDIPILKLQWSKEFMNDWTPSLRDKMINKGRLSERFSKAKIKYRWTN